MNSLNLQFLESYKRLDSLLKDMYQSEKGVYEYIDDMKKIHNGSCFVDDWDSVFKQLKHFRHIRNRLSHEEGSFYENLCNESDILWLDTFRESLMNQTDPISLHKKHTEAIKRKPAFKKVRQLPKASKSPAKALLSAALAIISFVVIFSLILIYFIYYR